MKRHLRSWLSISLCAYLAFGLCSVAFAQSDSLSTMYKAFTMAANSGTYSKAEHLLSSRSLQMLRSTIGVSRFCRTISRNGTIIRIRVLNDSVSGNEGYLKARVFYQDGTVINDTQRFVKQNGKWKLDLLQPN